MILIAPTTGMSANGSQAIVLLAHLIISEIDVVAIFMGTVWVSGLPHRGPGNITVSLAHIAKPQWTAVTGVPTLRSARDSRGGMLYEHGKIATHPASVLVGCRLTIDWIVFVRVGNRRVHLD